MTQNETKSILIVDDDPGTVFSLKERLHKAGYTVDSVRTPNQAMARLEAGKDDPPYHLAVLDLYLPNDWSKLRRSAGNLGVPRTDFNQGQLLGAWIGAKYGDKIRVVYYTSDLDFYAGDHTDKPLYSKMDSVNTVFDAIRNLLNSRQ